MRSRHLLNVIRLAGPTPSRVTPALGTPVVLPYDSISPKTTSAISVVVGDRLVAGCIVGHNTPQIDITDSQGGSWTLHTEVNVANYTRIRLWSRPVTTAGSVTVTFTENAASGNAWQALVVPVTGSSDGVGAASGFNVATTGVPSLQTGPLQQHSALLVLLGDWNAVDATGRVILTDAGSATELDYEHVSGGATVTAWLHPDVNALGPRTVGESAPAAQKYSIAYLEILGANASGSDVNASDTGGSVGAASVAVGLSAPDLAGAVSAANASANVAAAELVSAVDSANVAVSGSAADAGAAASQATTGASLAATDAATGASSAALTAATAAGDTASAADTASVGVTATDVAAAGSAASVAAAYTSTDTATAADTASVSVSATDSASAGSASSLSVSSTAADAAAVVDNAAVTVPLAAGDTATAGSSTALAASVQPADTAAGASAGAAGTGRGGEKRGGGFLCMLLPNPLPFPARSRRRERKERARTPAAPEPQSNTGVKPGDQEVGRSDLESSPAIRRSERSGEGGRRA